MKKFIKHFCVFAMLVCTLFTITACGAKIEGICVGEDATFEFFVGQTVDTEEITVYAKYSNDTKEVLPSNEITIDGIDTTTAGEKKFTVKYENFVIEVDYTVSNIEVASISLDATDMETECFVGETISTTGLVVTALYNNGEFDTVDLADVTFSTVDTTTAGTKTLTVTYAGKTATIDIVVKAVELEQITVDAINMKTEYYVGDTINTSGLVVTAKYNNGFSATVEPAELTFEAVDMTTAGQKTLVVRFGEKSATVNIVVNSVEIASIEAISSAMVTEYYVGETVDVTGLVVNKVMTNGNRIEINLSDADLVISSVDTSTAGTKTMTITYQGKTAIVEITVSQDVFVDIEVDATNMQTEYYEGDTLNTAGLVVKAVYESGEKLPVAIGLVSFSNVDMTTAGTKQLTVTYNGKTKNVDITIIAVVVTEITVDATNMKVSYYQGDTLDTTGLVITAIYNNSTSNTVDHADATFAGVDMATAGTQTLTVTYQGFTKNVQITVQELVLDEIAVYAQSMKTDYYVGDTIDTTGLVVKAKYNSGKNVTLLLSDVTFSSVDMTTAGTKELTVSYGGKSKTISITVTAVEPTGITANATAMKTNYLVGELLDTDGLVVVLNHNNSTTTPVSDYQLSDVDMTTAGTKTLTITYQGYTTTVAIVVTEPETDDWYVVGYEHPEFVATYRTNIEEKENKETEFKDRTVAYKVGTQNAFVFNPIVTAMKDPFDDQEIESVLSTYRHMFKIYIYNNSEYQQLTTNLETYVESIDERNGLIDFTSAAAGNKFKVEAKPYYFQDDFSVSFEFEVIDGYNIYNEKQLSIIDNTNSGWNSIKQQAGVDEVSTNKIIFQKNLILKDSDLASNLFYQENDEDTKNLVGQYPNIVGSLRDYATIYKRLINNGETFTIEGNYFTIDFTSVSLIVKFHGDTQQDQMTHSVLFFMEGEYKTQEVNEVTSIEHVNDITTDKYYFQNFSVIGNANRDEDTAKAGGLILLKTNKTELNATNIMSRAVGISWFVEHYGTLNLDKVRSYDSYSTSTYGYMRTTLNIKNSEIKRSGGPAILSNHDHADEIPFEYGITNIDSNSTIEAFVTGQEAWFDSMGVAPVVGLLSSFDALVQGYSQGYTGTTKSIYKNVNGVDQFNCLFGGYDNSSLMSASDDSSFYVKIGDTVLDMTGGDVVLDTYRATLKTLPTVPPIVQCNGITMFVYTEDGTNYSFKQLSATGFADPTPQDVATFFGGKYMTFVLYAGLAVIVELF